MGGGRPLSSFDELHSMAVLTASWWMLLMAHPVAGVAEWLISDVFLDDSYKPADQRPSSIRMVIRRSVAEMLL